MLPGFALAVPILDLFGRKGRMTLAGSDQQGQSWSWGCLRYYYREETWVQAGRITQDAVGVCWSERWSRPEVRGEGQRRGGRVVSVGNITFKRIRGDSGRMVAAECVRAKF